MSNEKVVVVATAAVVGVLGLGWFSLPMMQSARSAVDARAAEQVERARRLLHQYDADLAYRHVLTERLAALGVEADAQEAAELVEEYQEIHALLWAAHQPLEPVRPGGGPRAAEKANYGNIGGQIRDGLKDQATGAATNARLPDEALAAVDLALNFHVGGESSRTDVEANRLKASALYYKGLATWQRAQLQRLEAAPRRRELRAAAIAAAEAAAATRLVAESRIEDQIQHLNSEIAKREAAWKADQQEEAKLDQTIGQLEARLAVAEARRDEVAASVGRLKDQGVDFSDSRGGERFGIQLTALNQAYREAAREVHALTRGSFPTAKIDQTGDFLVGRYIEPGGGEPLVEPGLDHFRNERALSRSRLAGAKADLEAFRSDVARLEGIRSSLQQREAEATQRLEEFSAALADSYAELNRLESEAFTSEDSALRLLDQAAAAMQQAGRGADEWVAEARRHLKDLPPTAQERSAFQMRQRDGWMGGFTAAQEADARIAKAWVHLDRYRAANDNADTFAAIPEGVSLEDADADAEKNKAAQAREAGVAEIDGALAALKAAHAKAERNWTVGAQAAGAAYLLVLFGLPEYQTAALEGYRSAIKGREEQTASEVYRNRIARLERRK